MTRLKEFLKGRGSTQDEAAAVLGISKTALSNKATGKSPFKQSEIKKMVEVYEMTDEEIREVFL